MPTGSKPPKGVDAGAGKRAPSGKRPNGTAAGGLGAGVDAFDLWLGQSLRAAFGAAAAEPVPEDILRLIEEDRAERESIRRARRAEREE